jgi:hypothetical protein
MTSLLDLMTDVVAELLEAGIRATSDPRKVNVPAVLVLPASLALDVSCGGTATCRAVAITRGPANADAWKSLDDLVGRVAAVIDLELIEPTSYALDETAALPAYALNWTKAISWP